MSERPDGNGPARSQQQRAPDVCDKRLMSELNNIFERLASIETGIRYLATKDDISKTKFWVVYGGLGGALTVASLIFIILRYVDPS